MGNLGRLDGNAELNLREARALDLSVTALLFPCSH